MTRLVTHWQAHVGAAFKFGIPRLPGQAGFAVTAVPAGGPRPLPVTVTMTGTVTGPGKLEACQAA